MVFVFDGDDQPIFALYCILFEWLYEIYAIINPGDVFILFLANFNTSLAGIFYWISKSKSPKASQICLSILDDLKNTLVGRVTILPQMSNSSCLFSGFWGLFQEYQIQPVLLLPYGSTVFFCLFLVLQKDERICLSFHFLCFNFVIHLNGEIC